MTADRFIACRAVRRIAWVLMALAPLLLVAPQAMAAACPDAPLEQAVEAAQPFEDTAAEDEAEAGSAESHAALPAPPSALTWRAGRVLAEPPDHAYRPPHILPPQPPPRASTGT